MHTRANKKYNLKRNHTYEVENHGLASINESDAWLNDGKSDPDDPIVKIWQDGRNRQTGGRDLAQRSHTSRHLQMHAKDKLSTKIAYISVSVHMIPTKWERRTSSAQRSPTSWHPYL